MADSISRENWYSLLRASYGIVALASTVDDLTATAASMDREELDHLHGLTGALSALAQTIHEIIDRLNDARHTARASQPDRDEEQGE